MNFDFVMRRTQQNLFGRHFPSQGDGTGSFVGSISFPLPCFDIPSHAAVVAAYLHAVFLSFFFRHPEKVS